MKINYENKKPIEDSSSEGQVLIYSRKKDQEQ